ncbi:MAG: hypothetical protein GXO01_03360 [Epsilonproteobacteria bacterium]|nr:hypothetical protein [Campylobacterota bacterium]
MKNSKLLVMFITFAIMIAITPFIFNKLMNAKFNQMLDNLKKEGVVIKELKSKSTYLTTDRVFDVEIPQKVLGDNGIKYIKLRVEAVFKNLPVTDVKFFGKVKEVILKNFTDIQNAQFNSVIKDKIKFLVITPNFKTYKYKVFDNKILLDDNGAVLGYEGINGIVYIHNDLIKESTNIPKLYLNDNKNFLFQLNSLKESSVSEANVTKSSSNMNIIIKIKDKTISLNNINTNSVSTIAKRANAIAKVSVNDINIFNKIFLNKVDLNFEIKNVYYPIVEKIQNKPKPNENDLIVLIEKGLNLNYGLKIKNIKIQNKDLGFIDLNAKIKVRPTQNIKEKINQKNFDFIDLTFNLKTTPEIEMILMNVIPQSAFAFAAADKKNGIIDLQIEFKNNEVYINGQKVK